jgi:hypothetical protein
VTIHGPRTDEAGPSVDPSGAPVEDAGLDEHESDGGTPGQGRLLDRGAITAAFVGLGVAVTIVLSFGLVIAIQVLVFISAPLVGLLIGYYANHKSARWRPRWRLFANAGFAGTVTGLSLALMYVALRLLFIYADSGYRPETMGGQIECSTGPECTYLRNIEDDDRRAMMASVGVTGASSYEASVWQTSAVWTLELTVFTLAGALVAAGWRAVRTPPSHRIATTEVAISNGVA